MKRLMSYYEECVFKASERMYFQFLILVRLANYLKLLRVAAFSLFIEIYGRPVNGYF